VFKSEVFYIAYLHKLQSRSITRKAMYNFLVMLAMPMSADVISRAVMMVCKKRRAVQHNLNIFFCE